jgi:hypothetical protein
LDALDVGQPIANLDVALDAPVFRVVSVVGGGQAPFVANE